MGSVGGYVGVIASRAWRWVRVLWVCRVPVASAVGGGAALAFVPQARDLFADTGLSWWGWGAFFALLVVWGLLVHSMARRALQFDEWTPEAHVPGGLGEADRRRLRADYLEPSVWSERFGRAFHFGPATIVPRVLGALVFVFVVLALMRTRANFSDATGLTAVREAIARIDILLAITIVLGVVFIAIVPFSRDLRARMTKRDKEPALLSGAQSMLLLLLHPIHNWPVLRRMFSTRLNQILLAVAAVITFVFLSAVFAPEIVSEWFPRATFVPLMLGGGLLLFGEIAALSHRFSFPLLLGFFVVGGALGLALPNYNDVRWIAKAGTSPIDGGKHQLSMADAIARWRADNGCATSPETCPSPIVIAAAGGASRAGFFAATVVGAMIDAQTSRPGLQNIRNRIFAISSVSGGTTGAVMMRAAWMDALEKGDVDRPPCVDEKTTAWFRAQATSSSARYDSRPQQSWRDCFQQLLSGDFLSPVFVGLAYRDIFPIGSFFTGRKAGDDRSGLLEEAFERWYRRMTGKPAGACTDRDTDGLCRRLGHLPDRKDVSAPGPWLPLLFVNGTSVETGRRIVVSDVRVGCVGPDKRRFLDFAYDYREMRDANVRGQYDDCAKDAIEPDGIDMRLSTAALMSARFPVISTNGVIRDLKGNIVDSIVDGGYFENDGLATAADIVRELLDSKLKPVVIRIINEPDQIVEGPRQLGPSERRDGRLEPVRPPLPRPEDRTLFDSFTSIGRALYATRSGHEEGHLAYLRGSMNGQPIVRIGVRPVAVGSTDLCRSPVDSRTEMPTVSMSWWSSQPVQAYLDAQLCNRQVERLLCVLETGASGNDTCLQDDG